MKTLQILYSGLGGHGSVFYSIITGDKQKQLDSSALFYGVEPLKQEYAEKCDLLGVPYSYIGKRVGLDISSWFRVFKAIKQSKADYILMHSMNLVVVGILAKLVLGKRLIVVEHTANNVKTMAEWLWTILAILFANKVVLLTETYNQELSNKIPFIYDKRKIEIVANGIDLHVFFAQKNYITNNKIVIAMQARFSSSKDHLTLIKAFRNLKIKMSDNFNLKLILAGSGESMSGVQDKVLEYGLEDYIQFPGMLDERSLVSLLQKTSIYVHSSVAETMSTAIMQTMAIGLPIIATDIPGINEMIEHGKTGYLFSPRDVNGLEEKLNILINNPEERKRIGRNAREYAVNFLSNTRMAEKYVNLLLSL
jgi:glycosyltransferase involved in cell wall biosynthesis